MMETMLFRRTKWIVVGATAVVMTFGAGLGTAWAGSDNGVKVNADATKTRRVAAPQSLTTLMPQLIIVLKSGINPDLFANYYGLRVDKALANPNEYSFNTGTVAQAKSLVSLIQKDSAAVSVYQNAFVKRQRYAFTPNDPYYTYNNPSGFPGQWHLINTNNVSGANIDARVAIPWSNDRTGNGVLVGVCDDSTQTTHPDLSANYNSANSYDFGQNDGNPDPVNTDDVHGTCVAGVIAARGGNAVGVTGAAPFASWSGLRMDFNALTWAMLYDVIDYHSSGSNTSIKIKNHSYGSTDTYGASPTEKTRLNSSVTAGTIHTWAAGNARGSYTQDANKQEPQNSPDAITVAALSSTGKFASYSSFGANVMVTAPSSSSGGFAITTTDRTGADGYNGSEAFTDRNYTSTFGGTSSASPLTAGVLALVKQAQPNLNTRFAKQLIVISSDQVDAADATPESDGGWKTNGAGNKFNQNYGFGLVNANKLVNNSLLYSGVTALETNQTALTTVGAAIPDRTAGGDGVVTRTFSIASTKKLEEVSLYLDISHTAAGDVEAFLTSPSGTRSRLMYRSGSDYHANIDWTYTSNAFWGENPAGTWTVEVRDVLAADTGTWNKYRVTTRHGELIPVGGGSGDQAQFVSQTVPTTMYAGITYSATVNIKNTGTTTWTSAGYRLVSMNPYANSTWGRTTVTLAAADSIAPGATKSFVFNVTAPATAGAKNFQWQMRRTSGTPVNFGDLSTNVSINVITGNNAQFIEQSIPTTMTHGVKYNCFVTMRNMGTTTWTLADSYFLTTMNPLANNTWGFTRRDLASTDSILPTQYKTYYFKVLAPATPGTYNLQFQMRKGGVANFGDLTPNVAVTVN